MKRAVLLEEEADAVIAIDNVVALNAPFVPGVGAGARGCQKVIARVGVQNAARVAQVGTHGGEGDYVLGNRAEARQRDQVSGEWPAGIADAR